MGEGVEQDDDAAYEWFQAAAEQGYPRAQCNLGYCYESGKGVKEDKARAVKLYRQAAEQGSSVGQCNLGYCMLKGIGIRPDPAQAVYWFQKQSPHRQEQQPWRSIPAC